MQRVTATDILIAVQFYVETPMRQAHDPANTLKNPALRGFPTAARKYKQVNPPGRSTDMQACID